MKKDNVWKLLDNGDCQRGDLVLTRIPSGNDCKGCYFWKNYCARSCALRCTIDTRDIRETYIYVPKEI